MSPSREDEQPSEHSALLGQQNGSANGHVVDPEDQSHANAHSDSADEVVLAEEPPTRKLVLTMVAIWLGVFFAALGKANTIAHGSCLTIGRYEHCRDADRSYLIGLQLLVSAFLAGHWLSRRQFRLPASIRQADRYLWSSKWSTLQQLLLCRRYTHMRPRTQCTHHHRRASHCWHRRRRPDVHHHLRHLGSGTFAETRSLARLRQCRLRDGYGSWWYCGRRIRR